MGLIHKSGPDPRIVRSIILIDGAFLEKLIEEDFLGKSMKIKPFIQKIPQLMKRKAPETIHYIRTYYYDSVRKGRIPEEFKEKFEKKIAFLDWIEENCEWVDVKTGFITPAEKEKDGFRQKGADVLLGSDLALIAWSGKIDCIIIVAADGDYVPAVQVAKSAMINVYLISDKRKVNLELKKAVDLFELNLSDFIKQEQQSLIFDPSSLDQPEGLPVIRNPSLDSNK